MLAVGGTAGLTGPDGRQFVEFSAKLGQTLRLTSRTTGARFPPAVLAFEADDAAASTHRGFGVVIDGIDAVAVFFLGDAHEARREFLCRHFLFGDGDDFADFGEKFESGWGRRLEKKTQMIN